MRVFGLWCVGLFVLTIMLFCFIGFHFVKLYCVSHNVIVQIVLFVSKQMVTVSDNAIG